MPPLPPIANVVRLVPQFTWNGVRCNYVMHYRGNSALQQPDLLSLATNWQASFHTFAKPYVSNTCNLDYITAIDLGPSPFAQEDYTPSQPNLGTRVSPTMPNHVTIACAHRTALRGRSYRGRTYFIGLCEDQVVANTIDSTTQAGILAWLNNMKWLDSGSAADFFKLVVLSYWSGGALRGAPIATEVTTFAINPTIDSQRRRLPGRGR